MNPSTLFKICIVVVTCSWPVVGSFDQGKGASKKGKEHAEVARANPDDHENDRNTYFKRHGYEKLHIPPGHYPPPGECRIWYPSRPPGHQPPPMKCDRARAEVPPGAWIIRHPAADREHVQVVVYDDRRPGSIFVVGEFKIATGVFVRVVVDR